MPHNIQISQENIDAFLARYNVENPNNKFPLEFDEVRRKAIMGWDDLQACPGSGKTTLIAAKLMIIAKKWNAKYQGVCVLTHTNVACEEIRSRLKNDVDGHKLLSYPHFIGTIQEFVNKFLAIPITRSLGFDLRLLSGSEFEADFTKIIWKKFTDNTTKKPYRFNYYIKTKKIAPSDFYLIFAEGKMQIGQKFKSKLEKLVVTDNEIDKYLIEKKKEYLKIGRALYRDMYSFTEYLLNKNVQLLDAMHQRFPLVFMDEMQDTQNFQDEIINTIFVSEMVRIQRFGDPDQAIFDSMGDDEPNKTFNSNKKLQILAHSHRFTAEIADKVSTLSLKNIGEIVTSQIVQPKLEHTVYIFNDKSKPIVLEQFSKLVAECDPKNEWKTLKAIGAVGQSDKHEQHLGSYFDQFDKHKQPKHPKPQKLIDAINREWWNLSDNSEFQYKLIVQSFIDLMRIAEKLDTQIQPPKYFNHSSLKTWLINTNKYVKFRKIVTDWILNLAPNEDEWTKQANELKIFLELPDSEAVNCFLAYSEVNLQEQEAEEHKTTNSFIAENGREIEVGTIHSVKGETHDATLVLETKNHCNDLQAMLPFLTGERPNEQLKNSNLSLKPHHSGKPNQQFMRQLYVAFSRPKHLLCIALHQKNITDKQRLDLKNKGWILKVLD